MNPGRFRRYAVAKVARLAADIHNWRSLSKVCGTEKSPNCKEMQVADVSRLASLANSTITFESYRVVVGTTPDAID